MSINLTDKQYLMLSQLAYLDTPEHWIKTLRLETHQ